MKLICLGSAGYHPSNTRHTSCYYLPESGILLDAGSGLFRLAEHLKGREEVSIFLSHAHLDHVLGLTFLLGLRATTTLKQVRVFGLRGVLDNIRLHLFDTAMFPVDPEFEWIALEDFPNQSRVGGAKIDYFPLIHPGGSTGFRFDWPGKSMAYITDTTAEQSAQYLNRIREVDLLLHECNFADAHRDFAIATGHSHASEVLNVCRETCPKQVLLTHLSPYMPDDNPIDLEEALKNVGYRESQRLSIAYDGLIVEF